MQDENNDEIDEQCDEPISGTDGSIEFTSIKTLGNVDDIHLQ